MADRLTAAFSPVTLRRTILGRTILGGMAVLAALTMIALRPAAAEDYPQDQIREALQSRLATHELLLDVAKAGDRLVAVGAYGHIIYSDDKGLTWTQADRVETRVTLTTVEFVNDKVGFAAGHDTTIVKTVDGGLTWKLVYQDPEAETPIMSMLFEDENRGLVFGAFAFVMETTDQGDTWEVKELIDGGDLDYHLNYAFHGKQPGSIYVAAEFGTVYRSLDGGRSFDTLSTPYEGSFWAGLGVSDGSLLVFGMRGNVYRSEDQGATWTHVETGTNKSFGGGVELSNGTIVLAGLSGAVAYSTDKGKSFTTVTRPDREGYNAVAEGPDGQIVVFGEPGVKVMPNNVADAMAAGAGTM